MKLPKLPVGIAIRKARSGKREYWLLELGKRWTGSVAKRYTFASAKQAVAAWEKEGEKREALGQSAYLLTNDQVAEAKAALDAAAELQTSLAEIVAFYRETKRRAQLPGTTYDQAVKLALERPMRDRTRSTLKCRYKTFRAFLAAANPDAIKSIAAVADAHIRAYIDNGKVSHRTKRNRRDEISTLFRSAVEAGRLAKNPCDGIKLRVPRNDQSVSILTPEQTESLLRVTERGFSGEYGGYPIISQPYDCAALVAIGLFAGLRPNEILALDWQDIKDEHIDLAASKTKKGNRRIIPIPPTLRAWLDRSPRRSGPVPPENWHRKFPLLANAANLKPWPQDCLRHSYASYHYAAHKNLGDTMSNMGHKNSAVFFAHYREVVTPAAAARYWQIFPAAILD